MPGYTENHPEIVALEEGVKELRGEVGKISNEPLTSTPQIRLPFAVVSNMIETFVIPFKAKENYRSRCVVLHLRFFAIKKQCQDNKESIAPTLLRFRAHSKLPISCNVIVR